MGYKNAIIVKKIILILFFYEIITNKNIQYIPGALIKIYGIAMT